MDSSVEEKFPECKLHTHSDFNLCWISVCHIECCSSTTIELNNTNNSRGISTDRQIVLGICEDIKLFVDELLDYVQIQPKTYSTEYFEKADPFIKEIQRTGIELKI